METREQTEAREKKLVDDTKKLAQSGLRKLGINIQNPLAGLDALPTTEESLDPDSLKIYQDANKPIEQLQGFAKEGLQTSLGLYGAALSQYGTIANQPRNMINITHLVDEVVDMHPNVYKRAGAIYRNHEGGISWKQAIAMAKLPQTSSPEDLANRFIKSPKDRFPDASNIESKLNPDQMKLFDLPRDPYGKEELRVLKENLARKTGYESLAIWKREVLNKWPDKGDQLFRELWKNKQYEGYIEHKIGKASRKLREEDTDSYDMDWYWDKTFIDVDGTTKRGLNKGDRHSITNVRLLFNDRFKNLKDTTEKILYGSDSNPGIGVLNPNLKKRLIIDVEDPMSKQGVGYHTRQNPGDIVIKRAGSGEIIGNLGQYLDFLYPQAKGDQRRLEIGARSLGYKDITAFRTDLIRERINIIVRDTPILLSKPVEERRAFIQETIDNDMQQLAIKYPFLKPQAAIQSQISKDKGMSEKGLTKDRTKKRGGPFKGVTKTEQFNPRQFDWLNDPEYFPDE